jgi:glucokinase
MKEILAGDIGGTKSTLGLFSPAKGARHPLAMKTYASATYPDLAALAHDFLSHTPQTIAAASFGVAGPVLDGRAEITNLPWVIEEQALANALRVPKVLLLNDLVATAAALPLLHEPDDLHTIHPGRPIPTGNKAVIAPGTGLGESFLIWAGSAYEPQPSEGGHADFAPRTAIELDLLRFLQQKMGHVSVERICSGLGIQNIYRFLKEEGAAEEPPGLAAELSALSDPTPTIIAHALDAGDKDGICARTLEIFCSVLGAEAGNLALKTLATGGVYLGGGIPARILPLLMGPAFYRSLHNKGRFSEFMSRIPVYCILRPDAALIGAAKLGLAMIS